MNVKKQIDYSEFFTSLKKAVESTPAQMPLYCEIGRLVSLRPEKGAAVAAAEYLSRIYQRAGGFSPRNIRRMRDFYRAFRASSCLDIAMDLSWTINITVLENCEAKDYALFLYKAKEMKWSKSQLLTAIKQSASRGVAEENNAAPQTSDLEQDKETARFKNADKAFETHGQRYNKKGDDEKSCSNEFFDTSGVSQECHGRGDSGRQYEMSWRLVLFTRNVIWVVHEVNLRAMCSKRDAQEKRSQSADTMQCFRNKMNSKRALMRNHLVNGQGPPFEAGTEALQDRLIATHDRTNKANWSRSAQRKLRVQSTDSPRAICSCRASMVLPAEMKPRIQTAADEGMSVNQWVIEAIKARL